MKTYKFIAVACVTMFAAMQIFAQAPQKINYQAVARGSDGSPIANKNIAVKFTIRQGSATGTDVYAETWTTTTNALGVFAVELGGGSPALGSFASIDWSSGAKYLNIKIDPNGGSTYNDLGTYQMLSVPYALFAENVKNTNDYDTDPFNEIQTITLVGNELSLNKGGGSVVLPGGGGDNWGTQTVTTDATLTGNGLASNPLKIPDGAITSAKIQDNTIGTNDIGSNTVTGVKIADGTITGADIADRAIPLVKVSTSGAAMNDAIIYTGTDVAWGNVAGTRVRTTLINVSCECLASFSSTYVKISDLGSFTKVEANSIVEVAFEGRLTAATITGTGAHFELRVDDNPVAVGRARANVRASEAGGSGVAASITGIFTGLSTGTHTVSMWVKGATSGTNACVDPGCWSDDHVIVKETR